MSLFNINLPIVLTFFAVVVRYSILFSVLPFLGDRMVPVPVKVLTALMVSIMLFPVLVTSGAVRPHDATVWASTAGGIIGTLTLEVLFGLVLGYIAKLTFDGISLGANLVGNFMGFAAASYYDPHQESQTEVVAQVQNSLAMLIFLAIDGHHLMLKASLDSYRIVGLGKASFGSILSQQVIGMTSEVLRYGLQIAAPVAISLFSVNACFGLLAKAIPQLNAFVLSFAVSALVGFLVMFLSLPEFQEVTVSILGKSKEWMDSAVMAMANRR